MHFQARSHLLSRMGVTVRGETDEPIRLCSSNLSLITGIRDIRFPTYDRTKITPGVINLGLRDFHRVHSAVYFDDLLRNSANCGWGMITVALSEPQRKLLPELNIQNGLYSVVSRSESGASDIRVVGSVLKCKNSLENSDEISEMIGKTQIKMVMLTLKENNYFFTSDFSRLNENDPHIRFDMMTGSNSPQRTPVGILVAGLFKRFKAGGKPITVMSCDNLARNGEVARLMVEKFAVLRYPLETAFHRWISANVFYPNTMCDRICLTDPTSDRISLQQLYGVRDNALLTTESFSEWVVEKWMGEKPEGMKDVGIKLVSSTVPYENLKVRLNYGTRLAVAIIAKALGYARFEDAMKDEAILRFARRYMDEVSNAIGDVPKGIDLRSYKEHMLKRMITPQLNYVTHRVVESASKKIRTDMKPVLEQIAQGSEPMAAIPFSLAVWVHLVSDSPLCAKDGFPVIEADIELLEPFAKSMIISRSQTSGNEACLKLLSHIFGSEAPFNTSLAKQVAQSLSQIDDLGIRGALSILGR
jgi:mannitol-1-phosphate/altronate dehydrogenase